MIKHFEKSFKIWKIIIEKIFPNEESYEKKIVLNLDDLLLYIQNTYKSDFTISELKTVLFFLDSLGLIKIRNWLLVFLTRYSLYFNEKVYKNPEDFKKKVNTEELKKELIEKLEEFKTVKINKLLALQKIVEVLSRDWKDEYTKLTRYYFNTPIKEFTQKTCIKNKLNILASLK